MRVRELSGSSYVDYVQLIEFTSFYAIRLLRPATCNSRPTSPVANITRRHTMTADSTMYVCVYTAGASVYVSNMRMRLFLVMHSRGQIVVIEN